MERDRTKMVTLTPTASSILTLVAENPAVDWVEVAPLVASIDAPELREVVETAARIIMGEVALVVGNDRAAAIAYAYKAWALQNAQRTRAAFHREVSA